MPWIIENGYPVRQNVSARQSVDTRVSPPEVTQSVEFDVLVCPECGREYKTQAGLDSHLEDKH